MALRTFIHTLAAATALVGLTACGAQMSSTGVAAPLDLLASLPAPDAEALSHFQFDGAKLVKTEIGNITLGLSADGTIPANTPVYEQLAAGKRHVMSQALPDAVDLRKDCSAVRNQGNLGSCTSFSSTGMMEYYYRHAGHAAPSLSPLFVYYCERGILDAGQRSRGEKARALGTDTGASSYLAAYVLTHNGVAPESLMPYQDGKAALKVVPSSEALAAAHQYKADSMAQIKTIDGMKKALADGHAFILGMAIYPSFMTKVVARTGKMVNNGDGEKSEGGHSVLCVGYDNAKSAFIIRNSWGKDWGQDGYFEMPYEYVKPGKLYSCFTIL
jgi:C1A family cysteine protease